MRPVPEAIDRLVAASPKKLSSRNSPNEPQRATRLDSAGYSRLNHLSLAGQYEEWRWQPVRACMASSSSAARNTWASVTLRVSAHMYTGVAGCPFESNPRSPCQNVATPTARVSSGGLLG